MKISLRDYLFFATTLIGFGITWGTFSTKVNAQEKLTEPIPGLITKQAVMDVKLDYLIGLLEYKYGITGVRPSRPALLGR